MKKTTWLLVASIILLVVIPLVWVSHSSFTGTDTQAVNMIEELAPHYKPWMKNIWKPSGEMESMLFAFQAALGSIVIGYFFGFSRARMKYEQKDGQDHAKS